MDHLLIQNGLWDNKKNISSSVKAPDLRVLHGVTSSHGVLRGHLEVPVQVCFPGFNLTLAISTSNARILEAQS